MSTVCDSVIGAGFLGPRVPEVIGQFLYADSLVWTAIGFAAAGLFGSRFLFQWLHSERQRRLVVPWYFWHLSFWGSVLNLLYALHLDKAPLIAGTLALPFIYGRNLILLGRDSAGAPSQVPESHAR